MGNLVWHEYARLVSITASVYAVWASFWGLFYRKFFWDFIGGVLRNPGGLQPPASAGIFITLIVKAPVIQIFTFIVGMFMLMLEFPLKPLQGLGVQRSIPLRIVMLAFLSALAIIFYQGTNAAIWSLIAAGCYTRAHFRGEKMEEAKANRGKTGAA